MKNVAFRRYMPNDRQKVYEISKISKLEGYDIQELDQLYEDWPDGQLVAVVDNEVIGFLSG